MTSNEQVAADELGYQNFIARSHGLPGGVLWRPSATRFVLVIIAPSASASRIKRVHTVEGEWDRVIGAGDGRGWRRPV